MRDELHFSKDRLWGAIEEAHKKGYLGKKPFGIDYPVEVYVHTGAGAYICGEETSLPELARRAGGRASPQATLPSPSWSLRDAEYGQQSRDDRQQFRWRCAWGERRSPSQSELHGMRDGGVRLFGVSGHVKTPGVYECAVGLTMRELIYDLGGGMSNGKLLGVIPGGSSTPIPARRREGARAR